MASRFYFSDTLVAADTPASIATGGNWSNSGTLYTATRLLARTPRGDALTNRTVTETLATAQNIGLRVHVSEPLAAQNIAGTFSAVIKCTENATTADNALQVIIRVVSFDGSTQQAILYAGQSAALNATVGALGEEFPTTAATRIIPAATALSSFTCAAGDRVSVETGIRSYDTSATPDSGTFNYGHPLSTADFALTSGLTTNLLPWVEFSQTLLFAGTRRPTVTLQAVGRAGGF